MIVVKQKKKLSKYLLAENKGKCQRESTGTVEVETRKLSEARENGFSFESDWM